MKTKNNYLTFEEYVELGGELSELPFKKLEYRAEKKINKYTFNRFQNLDIYPQELKKCVYDLIELLDKDSDSNILRESVGNYSISKKSNEEMGMMYMEIITEYLSTVKVNNRYVLYRGADSN